MGPGGETLLEYSIYDGLEAGFSRVVLIVQPESEALFRRRFAQDLENEVPISFVHQSGDDLPAGRSKPWGTGHALLAAEPVVKGPFASLNADDFYGAEAFAALADFLRRPPDGSDRQLAMVGFELGATLSESGPVSRALCRLDDDGRLAEIEELGRVWKRDDGIFYRHPERGEVALRGDELVSMNLWGFPRGFFDELRLGFARFLEHHAADPDAEFLLPDVVRALVRKGVHVQVLRAAGRWCGLTYRRDLARARETIEELVREGRYPRRLWG